MTNSKVTKRALLSSAVSLLLCFTMLMGATFAWFTDSVSSTQNRIQAGNLKVDLVMYNGSVYTTLPGQPGDIFSEAAGNGINWEPGKTEVVYLGVQNLGSLALKYNMLLNITDGNPGLVGSLEYVIIPEFNAENEKITSWAEAKSMGTVMDVEAGQFVAAPNGTLDEIVNGVKDETDYFALVVHMKEDAGNEYQNGSITIDVNVVATQKDAEFDSFGNDYDAGSEYPEVEAKAWDGSADFALFGLPREATDDEIKNATLEDNEYIVSTAEELAAFAELVDAGKTFEGKTVKLASDLDLYCEDANGEPICFDPIGSYRNDTAFKGTFDGQGHSIKNMSQNTWALDNGYYYGDLGLGLFGAVEDAEIKNLKMDGANLSGESALVGIVAAVAGGDCTFENITVSNSKGADYQYYAGGIVGWASGNHEYIKCNVDASTTIAAQWGDFDNSTGGVIGGASGSATIVMKDCNVACRIDAYNDVTSSYQWYAYRRCGMLIGNSGKTTTVDGTTYAAAPQLTCENVKVTYGDWANYTYCEFAGTSWPYVRVQAGISNSAYSNPRYGNPTDANGNKVVDDNHVHNDGEDHQILCAFDQLYGGGQGVYGTPAHDGVTVVYNNK